MAEEKGISLHEWERRLAATSVSKEDLNRLVLNFLIIEGHKDAAEKFARDARLKVDADLGSIGERMAIRTAVHGGNMDAAISRLNDLNPEILETNSSLLFSLHQQRLIEFIRAGALQQALDAVQEELPLLCENNPDLQNELESTLTLLAFDALGDGTLGRGGEVGGESGKSKERSRNKQDIKGDVGNLLEPGKMAAAQAEEASSDLVMEGEEEDKGGVETCAGTEGRAGVAVPEQLRHLLQPSQRHKTAAQLNAAILQSQAQDKEAKLAVLLKMLLWLQVELARHVECPLLDSLVTAHLRAPSARSERPLRQATAEMHGVHGHLGVVEGEEEDDHVMLDTADG